MDKEKGFRQLNRLVKNQMSREHFDKQIWPRIETGLQEFQKRGVRLVEQPEVGSIILSDRDLVTVRIGNSLYGYYGIAPLRRNLEPFKMSIARLGAELKGEPIPVHIEEDSPLATRAFNAFVREEGIEIRQI